MARLYKIIKEKNPTYEEEMRIFKDKPEFQEEIPTHLYRIGEVSFDVDEEKEGGLTDKEIIQRIRNWSVLGVTLDKFGSKEELRSTLEMILEDIKEYPEVFENEEDAQFRYLPDSHFNNDETETKETESTSTTA